jgi:heme/copper-type cytochrome/quinol oxidase subunit 4
MELKTFIEMIRFMVMPKWESSDRGYSTILTILIVLACIAVIIFIIKNLSVQTK